RPYSEWIELQGDGTSYYRGLHPGDTPEAVFCVAGDEMTAREYCNGHRLWKS
ncbi:MAG: desulfoferrodoxin, partial [Candidatus Marinimicrobia bacterium]|nr:desulfoferrodoxin [Candidatus Neomarinimicrobiota bacterium]